MAWVPSAQDQAASRRQFLKGTTALAAGGLAAKVLGSAAYAAGGETLKVGLIGCGGRGTGAAVQTLTADSNTKLVAMADAFEDRLEFSLKSMERTGVKDRVAVLPEHRFVGFEGYKQVIDMVDVVLLATPPQFRPMHLRYAVEKGRHIFAEKPVAVDAPGIRSVLESVELARKKNLVLVSGLCWRYETAMQEMIKRVHDGGVGEIVALESTRYAAGVGKRGPRQPGWTDMEYHMRNWYYFTWLSGDFIVEQFVHELDKMAWVMGDVPPASVICTGGRQTRTAEEFGHVYDHFNAIFEYSSGVKLYAGTRHQAGCTNMSLDLVHGSKGRADLMKYTITGAEPWKGSVAKSHMTQLEHDAMYSYIRSGKAVNNGVYMTYSSMMAIMARMSAYTGKLVTWEQAMASQEDLSPPRYDWNVPMPDPPVAMPGFTPFV